MITLVTNIVENQFESNSQPLYPDHDVFDLVTNIVENQFESNSQQDVRLEVVEALVTNIVENQFESNSQRIPTGVNIPAACHEYR